MSVLWMDGFDHYSHLLDGRTASGAIAKMLDGVTRVNLTGVNTRPYTDAIAGAGRVSQIRAYAAGGEPGFYLDDLFTWADTGVSDEVNNDFIGDRKVLTLFPNADTAVADLNV